MSIKQLDISALADFICTRSSSFTYFFNSTEIDGNMYSDSPSSDVLSAKQAEAKMKFLKKLLLILLMSNVISCAVFSYLYIHQSIRLSQESILVIIFFIGLLLYVLHWVLHSAKAFRKKHGRI